MTPLLHSSSHHSLHHTMAFFLLVLFALVTSASACDRCTHVSKVAYFGKTSGSGFTAGACGYGALALGFNGGHIAAAVPSLFSGGLGCGSCFEIRCKNKALCNKVGTKVIVTDLNNSNKTDFVISSRSYRQMAIKGKDKDLLNLGIVDVEYKRIPCVYKKQNLTIRVEEMSKKPNYLAIKFLYQGGQTHIAALDVAAVGSSATTFLSHNYGAVWDTSNAPAGPLVFRFILPSGFDTVRPWSTTPLPADWKPGMTYDTGVQFNEYVAKESGCTTCDEEIWK